MGHDRVAFAVQLREAQLETVDVLEHHETRDLRRHLTFILVEKLALF